MDTLILQRFNLAERTVSVCYNTMSFSEFDYSEFYLLSRSLVF